MTLYLPRAYGGDGTCCLCHFKKSLGEDGRFHSPASFHCITRAPRDGKRCHAQLLLHTFLFNSQVPQAEAEAEATLADIAPLFTFAVASAVVGLPLVIILQNLNRLTGWWFYWLCAA